MAIGNSFIFMGAQGYPNLQRLVFSYRKGGLIFFWEKFKHHDPSGAAMERFTSIGRNSSDRTEANEYLFGSFLLEVFL